MVLYNAGKMARNVSKIINLPTCGGDKKGGLTPSVGWFNGMTTMAARNASNTQFGMICMGNFSNPSQQKARSIKMGIH